MVYQSCLNYGVSEDVFELATHCSLYQEDEKEMHRGAATLIFKQVYRNGASQNLHTLAT